MRNYLSLFILTVLTIKLFAQDITVSFTTSDAGAVIDSVQATNLATNNTISLPGNETLTLVNTTSGVSFVQDMKGSIFPNPCNGSATLQFATSTHDDATIQIVTTSGQLVMEKKQALSAGAHSYSVKFPGAGIYIVLARTSNGVLSFREVSTNTEMQSPSLEYSGSAPLVHDENKGVNYKSATTGKTLNYSTGNNIMYTLYSGKNIRVMVDKPTASKPFDVAFYECADKDGKNYKTVTIGAQTWMAENLAYLPSVNTTSEYSYTASQYYVYDYNGNSTSSAKVSNNYKTYGVLYNWPAALSACPTGWHLPSDAEWTALSTYLGGKSVAGGNLKTTTGWKSPNTGATNETGFSALPGGEYFNGFLGFSFYGSGDYGNWWSNTTYAYEELLAWHGALFSSSSGLGRGDHDKSNGYSVRCIKD